MTRGYVGDEEDWEIETERSHFNNNGKRKMLNHNWKIGLGLLIVFLVGGLQALHGNATIGSYADMALAVLLGVEHLIYGNTA